MLLTRCRHQFSNNADLLRAIQRDLNSQFDRLPHASPADGIPSANTQPIPLRQQFVANWR
ncbi:MAG TPA: hypothetical protein VGM76_18355 [Lacipirellulaceae bacterium]|jgi:hypothetical protein